VKVSVIIPAYNAADSLPRLLASLEAQTFRDFETIVVDDGSTDGTADVLAVRRPSIGLRVLRQPNAGASVARNAGLDMAQGEAVLFVDSDDVVCPCLLEWTVATLAESKADYALFGYREIGETEAGGLLAEWEKAGSRPAAVPLGDAALAWFAASRRVPSPWQALYSRASLAGRRFVPGIIYEDVPFIVGYLAGPARGVRLDAELYGYVRRASSQSHARSLLRWIEGIETGARALRSELDAPAYRLYAKAYVARWIRDMYRAAGRAPEDRARVTAFVRRALAEDLVRWGDFRFSRRLRILAALLGERLGRRSV